MQKFTKKEETAINEFALHYAQCQGWYSDIANFRDIEKANYGYNIFEQGKDVATVFLKHLKNRFELIPISEKDKRKERKTP